ncbi:S1C family serine protease [Aneurinibacillus tyrosinisolvens]|uniref:S1C family serine protease n=1 Tax=Aneurinibacillus tyrosinisolvens TaxID=1443435 RepID=UPI00063EF63F|nr:S1C family serine protease [Aneurinibacillus tyrosinisolvens]
MGYYDDEYDDSRNKRRRGGGSHFLTALISAIIGGLVVMMAVPTMLKSGYLPGWSNNAVPASQAGQLQPQPSASGGPTANYSVDVNSGIVKAVSKVENAVVGVINIQQQQDFFGGGSGQMGEVGTGSGIVFRKAGDKAYIVTNNHVIEGAQEVEVSLTSGEKNIKAKVVGADALTDLAVLEIDASKVKSVAEFGSSSTLKVGEPAIAIGNPLGLNFSRTVTQGIISSTERTMPVDINNDGQEDYETTVLQTDAAINPGNSGGALVNIAGQVIGINSLKISKEGVEGLGFAIPIDDANKVINDLIQYKSVQRPKLGIDPVDLQSISTRYWKDPLNLPDSVTSGVVVRSATSMDPADRAGIKKYDVIVKLDNQTIENSAQLRKYLYKKRVGDTLQVTFYHTGQLKTVNVVLAKQDVK